MLTEPAYSVPIQGLRSPSRIISPGHFPATGRARFLHLHHSRFQLYPFSHQLSARPERCKEPYLQLWKQSEVNNEARLLCFMCHGEIATWLKSQLGERQSCSHLSQDSTGTSYIVPLVSRPLPWLNVPLQPIALIMSDAHCPAVSLCRDHYKCY